LLKDNVSIFKGKGILYHEKHFIDQYGISPFQWKDVKAIAGCKSDEVPGIKGVGEKTAIKFILKQLKGKKYDLITSEESKKIIERNKKLVYLPHSKTKKIKFNNDETNLDRFKTIFKKFKMNYFLRDRMDEWENLCCYKEFEYDR